MSNFSAYSQGSFLPSKIGAATDIAAYITYNQHLAARGGHFGALAFNIKIYILKIKTQTREKY